MMCCSRKQRLHLYTMEDFTKLMVVFKSLFVSTYSVYRKELFILRDFSYSLKGKKLECIQFQAEKIWNSLPDSKREMTSLKILK